MVIMVNSFLLLLLLFILVVCKSGRRGELYISCHRLHSIVRNINYRFVIKIMMQISFEKIPETFLWLFVRIATRKA